MSILYYESKAHNDYLAHHGVLGQKWGKRNGPPYPLNASDHSSSENKTGWRKSLNSGTHEDYSKAHSKESVKNMSDKELNKVVNRLNKEKEYNKLMANSSLSKKTQKIVKTAVTAAVTATLTKYANKYAKKGMKIVEELLITKAVDKVDEVAKKKAAELIMTKIMKDAIKQF